jgi:cellobiose-specific phosphotransferase system component IIB
MIRVRKGKRTAIGLDIGPRFIGAVQMTVAGRGARPSLAAASRLERAKAGSEPTSVELLRVSEALSRQGFSGQDIVLVTPQSKLLSGVFEVPPRASGAPLDQIARNELARANKLEASQVECGWWELPPGLRETEGA